MQTKAKSNSVVTHGLEDGDNVIVFKVKDAGELRLDLRKVSDAVRAAAIKNGFVQRVADAAALSRNTTTGKSATPQEKYESMKRLVDHYNSGAEEWRVTSEGAGLDSIVIAAIAEVTGKGIEETKALVTKQAEAKKLSARAYLAVLATSKAVAPVVARIRSAGTGVDAEEALDELMEGEDEGDDEGGEGETSE
jgi:hypothetical protein